MDDGSPCLSTNMEKVLLVSWLSSEMTNSGMQAPILQRKLKIAKLELKYMMNLPGSFNRAA